MNHFLLCTTLHSCHILIDLIAFFFFFVFKKNLSPPSDCEVLGMAQYHPLYPLCLVQCLAQGRHSKYVLK